MLPRRERTAGLPRRQPRPARGGAAVSDAAARRGGQPVAPARAGGGRLAASPPPRVPAALARAGRVIPGRHGHLRGNPLPGLSPDRLLACGRPPGAGGAGAAAGRGAGRRRPRRRARPAAHGAADRGGAGRMLRLPAGKLAAPASRRLAALPPVRRLGGHGRVPAPVAGRARAAAGRAGRDAGGGGAADRPLRTCRDRRPGAGRRPDRDGRPSRDLRLRPGHLRRLAGAALDDAAVPPAPDAERPACAGSARAGITPAAGRS